MKIEKTLSCLNSFEKNSFLKIIEGILSQKPKNFSSVEKILSETSKDLKTADNQNISKVFNMLQSEFEEHIRAEFANTSSQLDILIDIISREGNGIMKADWFARLYEKELSSLNKKLKVFKANLEDEKADISTQRKRDYKIYYSCLHMAYVNDEANNQDKKITSDEQSILQTLSSQLELSQEEIKLINYLIIPAKKLDIETIINDLKSIGVIFFSKKNNIIYVPDEIVRVLRRVRGKEISNKFMRRVLKSLKESQLNMVCRKHGIDWKLSNDMKIKSIINEGISFKGLLLEDIHKEGTKLLDKKKFLNEFCDSTLKIQPSLKGILIEEKVANLIRYFEDIEKDEKVEISIHGYERLLIDLSEQLPATNSILKSEFEFQEEEVLKSEFLLDFNIKPRDILELIPSEDLTKFCVAKTIKTRGDIIQNILEMYKDADNLYLENYASIGYRDLATLKNNGINIKEVDLGLKFEELTKTIFKGLGFNVDEEIRKKLNTNKDKADIIISLGNNELIIIECKSIKESGFNKFSSVSRQLKAYSNRASTQNFRVVKSLLVAPEFSDDFIKECGLDYDLNLSLITASTLVNILDGFQKSKLKSFPHNLLMRDVLIQEERVLKAISK